MTTKGIGFVLGQDPLIAALGCASLSGEGSTLADAAQVVRRPGHFSPRDEHSPTQGVRS